MKTPRARGINTNTLNHKHVLLLAHVTCEILDPMSLLSLEELRESCISWPTGPAIYFLFLKGELVYVGCSKNVLARIGGHSSGTKHRKDFDSYTFVPVPEGTDMEDLERRYIAALRPSENVISLFPSDFGPPKSEGTPFERAMQRIAAGQTPYSAAKAEGIDPQRIYGTKAYRDWKNEADKLLLQSGYAQPSEEGFRGHWNAGLSIYQASNRDSSPEAEDLK